MGKIGKSARNLIGVFAAWAIIDGLAKTCEAVSQRLAGSISVLNHPELTAFEKIGVSLVGLFIMELTRTIIAAGGLTITGGWTQLPQTVQDSTQRRISRLTKQIAVTNVLCSSGKVLALTVWASSSGHQLSIGVWTLLVMLSVVPAAIIDRLRFQIPITGRRIAGIAVYMFACWIILGGTRMNFGMFLDLREYGWTWIAIFLGVLLAFNHQAAREISLERGKLKLDQGSQNTFAENWQVGIFALKISALLLVLLSFNPEIWRGIQSVVTPNQNILWTFATAGLMSVVYVHARIRGYAAIADGSQASLTEFKIFSNTSYLTMTILADIVMFNLEPRVMLLLIGIPIAILGQSLATPRPQQCRSTL